MTRRELFGILTYDENFFRMVEKLALVKELGLRSSEIILRLDAKGRFAGVEYHPREIYDGQNSPRKWAVNYLEARWTEGLRNTWVEIKIDGSGEPTSATYKHYQRVGE